MKLPHPFYRLPIRFDVPRLQAEAAQFSDHEWRRHPSGFAGNSAIPLISVGGAEDGGALGPMGPAAALERCPYIRQVLESFGVVWGRSRLMRLEPGATVPEHADVNYLWFNRVRVHIPVVTAPGVQFHCGGQTVHMAAGELWVFDNWRRHSVVNDAAVRRVHLVADTTGSAAFWERVLSSQHENFDLPAPAAPLAYRPDHIASLHFERHNCSAVLPPAEIELLVGDLVADAEGPPEVVAEFRRLLAGFCADWRMTWSLHADDPEAWPRYEKLRTTLRDAVTSLPQVICASNGIDAFPVLGARVLLHALNPNLPGRRSNPAPVSTAVNHTRAAEAPIERPIFIIAAPRSGSTLLFETLAQAPGLFSVGGEAHWLVEGRPQLRPGAPGVESNRLDAGHVTPESASEIERALRAALVDRDGKSAATDATLRILEKTPKNALRVPFFQRIFPDARFIFLWRDPRENISSMIEAWRSGRWRTYRQLPGRSQPWSLLLPPGWRQFGDDAPVQAIAAYQWRETNRIALDDLAAIDPAHWISLSYADLLANPEAQIRRLCEFADIAFDDRLAQRLNGPLPLSAHTHTPPRADKWLRNRQLIEPVLPQLEPILARLIALRSEAVQ